MSLEPTCLASRPGYESSEARPSLTMHVLILRTYTVDLTFVSAPSLYWLLQGMLEFSGSEQVSGAPAMKNAQPGPAELGPPSFLLGHHVWLTVVAPSTVPLSFTL